MSPPSTIHLHNILIELEADLAEAFRLPPHSDTGQKIFRHLQRRFAYINNLLSASKHENADEIGEKLAGLKAAFRCWSDYRSYALTMYLDDAPPSVCSHCIQTAAAAEENFAGKEKGEFKRILSVLGKLCGAFGGGVIVGVVCYTSIINFSSFYFLQYQHLYFIPPT